MKTACLAAAALALAFTVAMLAAGQVISTGTMPSPPVQAVPLPQPAPAASTPTLTSPTTTSFAATATTSPLLGTTSAFFGAPFNSPGAQVTQPLPTSPFSSPGAPFNAPIGAPFTAAPGTVVTPGTPAPPGASPTAPGVITAPAPGGSPSTMPRTAPAPRRASLRLLDEANAERHRALAKEFSKRHDAMVKSAEWTAASRSERKTKLQALNLNPNGLAVNLVSFNVGVEVGQILALSLILLAMAVWRRTRAFGPTAVAANALLMTAGFVLVGQQLAGYFLGGG